MSRPVLHIFSTSLVSLEDGDSELCKSIKTCIVDYLNSKYTDPATSDLLDIASLVDPRFRDKHIPSEKINAVKNQAVTETESLTADQGSYRPDPAVSTVSTPTDLVTIKPPTAKSSLSLASFFKQSTTISTSLTRKEETETQVSSYLQSVIKESDTDPLKWWKEPETLFPALSHLAKKYLLVPATSSPSERVFSCSGIIVTCHRASLKLEVVDGLVFHAQNL